MAPKQGQSKNKLKGATTESQCSQKVSKKTLGTTRAGRPSKLAVPVYEDDKVLEEMDMSGSEEVDPGESLFKMKKKNRKRKASTPNKKHTGRQVSLVSMICSKLLPLIEFSTVFWKTQLRFSIIQIHCFLLLFLMHCCNIIPNVIHYHVYIPQENSPIHRRRYFSEDID